jgi:hypothetical protein
MQGRISVIKSGTNYACGYSEKHDINFDIYTLVQVMASCLFLHLLLLITVGFDFCATNDLYCDPEYVHTTHTYTKHAQYINKYTCNIKIHN